jgi:hypothetical protein
LEFVLVCTGDEEVGVIVVIGVVSTLKEGRDDVTEGTGVAIAIGEGVAIATEGARV